MDRTRRPKKTKAQKSVPARELTGRLGDCRLGGTIMVDYLFDLFAASPFERFSRLNVLSLLDEVKNDKTLFPDCVRSQWLRLSSHS